jgi:hypothetical protein
MLGYNGFDEAKNLLDVLNIEITMRLKVISMSLQNWDMYP